ncbi:MAG: hypothetical protein WA154_04660 [Moraxellaceae bacterium]
MAHLMCDSVLERKNCLSSLVEGHLKNLGHSAEIIKNKMNSAGHTDTVLVSSSVGLVHCSATPSTKSNAYILVADFDAEGGQDYLADKDWVAFGWNRKDKTTSIMFLSVEAVRNKRRMSKQEIIALRDRQLSIILTSV